MQEILPLLCDSFSIIVTFNLNFISERTFRKAPQKPPSSVNIYGVNPSTVRVVWRYVQPSPEEEPLQGYKVKPYKKPLRGFIYIASVSDTYMGR